MAGGTSRTRPARAAGRPSAEAAGELEAALMDAALTVFIASGYAGASMEAIARAAGITKRTLYKRVQSKQALFAQVVERLARRAGVPRLSRLAGDSLEARLKRASDILLAWFLEPDALALYRMIVADAARQPGLALTVDAPFQRAADAIAAVLAEEGGRSPETVRLGAHLFVRLVAGEALDRAAQGIEAAGTSRAKRARAHVGVEFFLAGWRAWRVPAG